VTKLVRVRHGDAPSNGAIHPHETPSGYPERQAGRAIRIRHVARHSRAADLRPSRHPSLSIRSAERRRWAAELNGPGRAAMVIYGMGGIGKSTLAAQIAVRLSRIQPGRAVSTISGEVSAAAFAAGPAETDFIICDNFDDNLTEDAGHWTVADSNLAALLAGWPGKLLITCRHPFTLPGADKLSFRQLGPLTRSGAAELITSMPAIRLLEQAERDHVWRLTAGHPLALEYFDLLLARGERYRDLAGRLAAAIQLRTGQPVPAADPSELPESTAQTISWAAGSLMFGELHDRLSSGAKSLLLRASVFRAPAVAEALASRGGQIAECEAAGLLTIADGHELIVHRWTADELHLRMAEAGLAAQLAAAHRQAASYWQCRVAAAPQTAQRAEMAQRAELELHYHQRRAAELARQDRPAARRDVANVAQPRRRRAVKYGIAGAFAVMSVLLAVEAAHGFSAPHLTSADAPATSSPVTGTVTVRDQAATWVARDVSAAAIVACDPAMCDALTRQGVASGNLLALSPGAGDPLGSAVVVETAAVRGMFGPRLAGVYAPEVLASFGTGSDRINVRVVAPDGTAAYRTALAADQRERKVAGAQLAQDPRLVAGPAARAALAAGQVDARLLISIAALAAGQPLEIAGFGDAGPGASSGLPLRSAALRAPEATARRMLAFLRAQRSPYLPAHAGLTPAAGGMAVVTIRFAAPTPLGLLGTQQLTAWRTAQ
jgi:hypothetical protein